MSHEEPIPRVLREVPVPPEVVASLREVRELIESGDEATTTPTDDCIQVGCLCGGLMDDESGRFYFSVHLVDNSPYIWDIALSPSEIVDYVEGKKNTMNLWCCQNQACGFKTYIQHITCHWCDYGGDRTP